MTTLNKEMLITATFMNYTYSVQRFEWQHMHIILKALRTVVV